MLSEINFYIFFSRKWKKRAQKEIRRGMGVVDANPEIKIRIKYATEILHVLHVKTENMQTKKGSGTSAFSPSLVNHYYLYSPVSC